MFLSLFLFFLANLITLCQGKSSSVGGPNYRIMKTYKELEAFYPDAAKKVENSIVRMSPPPIPTGLTFGSQPSMSSTQQQQHIPFNEDEFNEDIMHMNMASFKKKYFTPWEQIGLIRKDEGPYPDLTEALSSSLTSNRILLTDCWVGGYYPAISVYLDPGTSNYFHWNSDPGLKGRSWVSGAKGCIHNPPNHTNFSEATFVQNQEGPIRVYMTDTRETLSTRTEEEEGETYEQEEEHQHTEQQSQSSFSQFVEELLGVEDMSDTESMAVTVSLFIICLNLL